MGPRLHDAAFHGGKYKHRELFGIDGARQPAAGCIEAGADVLTQPEKFTDSNSRTGGSGSWSSRASEPIGQPYVQPLFSSARR